MSRSWERKVRRNTAQINQKRKKQGLTQLKPGNEKAAERFRGRNFVMPILFLLIIALYTFMSINSNTTSTMTWVTFVMYVLMAFLFYMRRPYLAVGQDYVQTRRMFGDRKLKTAEIKSITVSNGYVIIQPVKGANWVFSRALNRYPIAEMKERLQQWASQHQISYQEGK